MPRNFVIRIILKVDAEEVKLLKLYINLKKQKYQTLKFEKYTPNLIVFF